MNKTDILLALAMGLILAPFFFWIGHPELTQMQVFMVFGIWCYVPGVILALIWIKKN